MVSNNRLPLIEGLDTKLPPISIFELFRNEPFCFFLDSSMDPLKLGRFSFMGSSPFLFLKSRGDNLTLVRNNREATVKGNPFDVLGRYLKTYKLDAHPGPVPFTGGAVGYLGYDLCHFIERLPENAVDDLQLPECCLGFYDLILAFDNLKHRSFIISTGFPETDEKLRIKRARDRLEKFKDRLSGLQGDFHAPPWDQGVVELRFDDAHTENKKIPADFISKKGEVHLKGNFTRKDYIRAVEKARRYIIDGDIFEVNLSQRFEAEIHISPYKLYQRLRQINPAPFSAYLNFDEVAVVSSSPERFLRCEGDLVETRPIKGTIRRGKTPEEDESNARELINSSKDHAENMMIVDLERNDLGRVCRFGSVKVTELAILEKFPTVFHLTSTVVGRLKANFNFVDLLKATFPGGSITGAPKVRSMEIIDELEPTRRSVYTGSIGYLGFNGNIDLNIVIRTFLIKESRAYFQVGGAVVYDSDPELEYQETLDKAKALIDAIDMR